MSSQFSMLTRTLIAASLALALGSPLGCASADTAPAPGDEVQVDVVSEALGGGWWLRPGALACGSETHALSRRKPRHVHAIEAQAGARYDVSLEANWPARLGAVLLLVDSDGEIAAWDVVEHGTSAKLVGEHRVGGASLLFVGPLNERGVRRGDAYRLNVRCEDSDCQSDLDCGADERCVEVQCVTAPCPALCQAQPLCAEAVTTANVYHARQFGPGQRAQAEAWVQELSPVTSGVNPGACAELNSKECRDDAPVCGQPSWASYPKDFASLCELQRLVRANLEDLGDAEASASFTAGNCAADCGADVPGKSYVGTPEECTRIRFVCEAGQRYFSDACGCGCLDE